MSADPLFPQLSAHQIEYLRPFGREVSLEPGETLFAEGDPEDAFYVILAGELRVTRQVAGEETLLRVHQAGEFTGALSMLADGISIATARAVGACRLLHIHKDGFQEAISTCPAVAGVILFAMAQRRPEADAMARQHEKLAALGKLSAGLAHELNNPAAAARRAAQQLGETLQSLGPLTLKLGELCLTPETRERMTQFAKEASQRAAESPSRDPLAQSDLEEAVSVWLDAHHVPDSWDIAPTLAEAGLEAAGLETVRGCVGEEALGDSLAWLAATLTAQGLVRQVENSAARISELVQAIKSYTYMDQAPRQEVDVHEGLDNTLTMLGHKLKGITVRRDYDRSLPRIPAYGGALNQVWMNLIDNAADAMGTEGALTLRTEREGDHALIEIRDTGPGIPGEVKPRIFEPFFTTKAMGEGTGLGLDTVYRVVVQRHHGDIQVESRPGDTCFQVRLPLTASLG